MAFTLSEVADHLQSDPAIVERWCSHFDEFLSSTAKVRNGESCRFSAHDLQVLAYVCTRWEDDPDLESICAGLNSEDHYEDIYREFVAAALPLFQEPPEDLDETWEHGTLVGGIIAGTYDIFSLADSYKLAGDTVLDFALTRGQVGELIYPVLYNYRHSVELYLKAIIPPTRLNHNLSPLLERLEALIATEFKSTVPKSFSGVVHDFMRFDPKSTTFRYGDTDAQSDGECWIDLPHLKLRMKWLADGFHRILRAKGELPRGF